jgi:bifunctional pyridoxal-dependent enzyme with beta-cystathionase and maltose regulon repressor activities
LLFRSNLPQFPHQDLVTGEGRRRVAVDASSSAGPDGPLVLDLAALRDALAAERPAALLWCSPHNPTGRVWLRDELRAVAKMCKELDVFIISDEIHSDLTLWGEFCVISYSVSLCIRYAILQRRVSPCIASALHCIAT